MKIQAKGCLVAALLLGVGLAIAPLAGAQETDGIFNNPQAAGALTLQGSAENSITYNNQNTTTSMDNTVLQNAAGNIGANVAAGDANQQANATAIVNSNNPTATIDISAALGFQGNGQREEGNTLINSNGSNSAVLEDQVLQNGAGNIGANVAAGVGNQQSNSMAALNEVNVQNPNGISGNGALIGQDSHDDSYTSFSQTNVASLQDQVVEDATGNIGVNVAAGGGNQQANALALANNADAMVFGIAGVAQEQHATDYTVGNSTNNAFLNLNVLENATGNIGANVAAGNGNMQGNAAVVETLNNTQLALNIGVAFGQSEAGDILGGTTGTSNTASLTDEVLDHASGNIGVNLAAGTANMQSNALTLVQLAPAP